MWPFTRSKKQPDKPTPNTIENQESSRHSASPLVIGLAQAKLAAIYFDYSLPLIFEEGEYLSDLFTPSAPEQSTERPVQGPELLESLLLPGLWEAIASSFRTTKEWAVVQLTISSWQEYQKTGRLPDPNETGGIEMAVAYWMSDPSTAPIRASRYLLGMLGLTDNPVLLSETMRAETKVGDVRIDQTNVELIDPTRLTWRQILDLRKDKASCRALRQVCHVLGENGGGRTQQEIESGFNSRWQQHHAVCDRLGLARRMGQFSLLCGWASPMAVAAASNIAILLGSATPDDLTQVANHEARIGNAMLSMNAHHIFGESRNLVYYLMHVYD